MTPLDGVVLFGTAAARLYGRQRRRMARAVLSFSGTSVVRSRFRGRFEAVLWFVYGAGSEAPPSGREVDGLSFEVQH